MDIPKEQLLQSINFFSEEVDLPDIDQIKTSKWIQNTIKNEGSAFSAINIVFCSDEFLLQLNKEHLSHDYYTDIITFQYEEEPIEGDLFVSIDRVQDNAKQRAISYENELYRVIIHGILHMIGYSDQTEDDKKLIRSKEDLYLLDLES